MNIQYLTSVTLERMGMRGFCTRMLTILVLWIFLRRGTRQCLPIVQWEEKKSGGSFVTLIMVVIMIMVSLCHYNIRY